ncbi:hypothetical protein Mapa_007551 [Marchantia paleacea]|nr:hypothetical protein Mapa_007551 [Marchantia paleacea]
MGSGTCPQDNSQSRMSSFSKSQNRTKRNVASGIIRSHCHIILSLAFFQTSTIYAEKDLIKNRHSKVSLHTYTKLPSSPKDMMLNWRRLADSQQIYSSLLWAVSGVERGITILFQHTTCFYLQW